VNARWSWWCLCHWAYTLCICVTVSRKFTERQTRDVKMCYFVLKCITQTGNMSAWLCTAHAKNSFSTLHKSKSSGANPADRHRGSGPGPLWGLPSPLPRSPEIWIPQPQKSSYAPDNCRLDMKENYPADYIALLTC